MYTFNPFGGGLQDPSVLYDNGQSPPDPNDPSLPPPPPDTDPEGGIIVM